MCLSLSLITTPSFLSCHNFLISFNSLPLDEAMTLDNTSIFSIFSILSGIRTLEHNDLCFLLVVAMLLLPKLGSSIAPASKRLSFRSRMCLVSFSVTMVCRISNISRSWRLLISLGRCTTFASLRLKYLRNDMLLQMPLSFLFLSKH